METFCEYQNIKQDKTKDINLFEILSLSLLFCKQGKKGMNFEIFYAVFYHIFIDIHTLDSRPKPIMNEFTSNTILVHVSYALYYMLTIHEIHDIYRIMQCVFS